MKTHLALLVSIVLIVVCAAPVAAQEDCLPGSPECYYEGDRLTVFCVEDACLAYVGYTVPPYPFTLRDDTIATWMPGLGAVAQLHAGTTVIITARINYGIAYDQIFFAGRVLYIPAEVMP